MQCARSRSSNTSGRRHGGGSPATTPIPKSAPAALYHQRTRLAIILRRPAIARSPERDVVWTLDCQDPYASTFAHPRAACSRVIRDRWALFAPTSDVSCGGVEGADTIDISGQFTGRTIDYTPGSCDIHTLTRWEQFLHVTPR